jgi:small GTP-binding protein
MKKLVIGILAHVDAGKTTLSEAMLYLSGKIKKPGRVDHRDTYLDNHALERERGITIFSKQALLDFGDSAVTLLDTPGHADFSSEMERTLQVLDYAVWSSAAPTACRPTPKRCGGCWRGTKSRLSFL